MIEGWQGWGEGGSLAVTHSSRRGGAQNTQKNGRDPQLPPCGSPKHTKKTNKLVGQKILYAFDDEHYGWYIGTIAGTGLGARDLKDKRRAQIASSLTKGKRPSWRLWTGSWHASSLSICMG